MLAAAAVGGAGAQAAVNVVATTQDYAAIARELGGDRVTVAGIVPGNSDPHFLKPKPSYALMLRDADLLISTGLDLELWLPVLVNKAGNRDIVEGAPGFVAVAQGLELLERPVSLSRSEGDVHVFGNPHIHTSPINAKTIARNIATGLCKVDPQGCTLYETNLAGFNDRLSRKLYGDALVDLLGAATLDRLAAAGELVPFLERQGIADKLAGWLGQARSLHGRKLITYHKNWVYLTTLLGLRVLEYVEPKPGIPPTARHVADLIELIETEEVPVLLAANYFERRKPQSIADRTGIIPVVAPLSVGGEPGIDTYEGLVDMWITRLVRAYNEAGAEGDPHRHRHRHGGEQAPSGGQGTTPAPDRWGEGR
jgi:ABC-type Zn uptake system ZnuABC Zn-binding protein ZnuA